jgi:replication factor C small subunit
LAEKYRPKTLAEVVGQDHITTLLKRFVDGGEIPHMMFSGPPGTGKTATAIALAKELFGAEWEQCFKEINASDERGIKVVREKIKDIAGMMPLKRGYKIIFLDESDELTNDAQAALRRTIETTSSTCRFIFSCNHPNKIIEPIADRLVEFRFKPLKALDMKILLDKVIKEENIDITPEAVSALGALSLGSMRKALKILTLIKMANLEKVDNDKIYELTNWIHQEFVERLVIACTDGDLERVDKRLNDLLHDKVYDPTDILIMIRRVIKELDYIPLDAKLVALKELGMFEYRFAVGCNAELQLKTLMAYLMLIFKKYMKKEEVVKSE